MASIVFDHVSKQFFEASLNDCTLEIQDKDFFVFLGPAGSGKSTAIRCLQGLLDLDSGRIFIDRQDVTTWIPKERNLRAVGSTFSLYPKLNVFENLAFGLKNNKMPVLEITHQVKGVAEKLGLEPLLQLKPNQLTKDQRLNVTIGRVMLQKPAAFIFTTELSRLEPSLFENMIENLIRFYRVSGLTCITSTENSKVALRLGTRIAMLKHGILEQVDTPQNLIDHPANAFVSEFIGAS